VTHRDLHVDLLDVNTNFIAGAVQRVGASSGIQEMTISHPDAAPGRYFVNSFLTEPGQTWTQALAWSAVRQITLLPASYLDWVQWRWGVVLGNDLILPTQDADGDGANNDEERIAHTAPLNPEDVLRLNLSRIGGRLVLTWRSAVDREYQLFECADLASNSWMPLGSASAGTGDTLQVPIALPTSGPPRFCRLQVSETAARSHTDSTTPAPRAGQ